MSALREKVRQSENEKEQLRLELRATDSALQDAQQRLHTLQVCQLTQLLPKYRCAWSRMHQASRNIISSSA